MKIYLDNSATTKVDKYVKKTIQPYFDRDFGNASSIHSFGQKAREMIDNARNDIALILNCSPDEIIFTSGGSESDNLAIRGIIESSQIKKPHIITSKIEHHAVLHLIENLEKRGIIEASYLKVDKRGIIKVSDIEKAVKKNTLLVSVMYVNNETGAIQPIREIGKMIERINKDRETKIFFHTDAVQAAGSLNLDVLKLHVHLLTLTAHKIHGPKGIGLLYLKKGTPLVPQIIGGSQEHKLRAGTENVAGIVGLSCALSLIVNKPTAERVKKLRNYMEEKLKKEIKEIQVNGHPKKRAGHILNVSFRGVEGESILLSLDMEGVAASSGSACTSGSLEPSHVLIAMGIQPMIAQGSVRFSFSKYNNKEEVDYVVDKLKKIVKRLREISPIK